MNQSLALGAAAVVQSVLDAGLAVSTMTVQAPPITLDSTGAPTGPYTDVPGLVDLTCMNAPDNVGNSLSASEQNAMAQVESMALRHVLIPGYYSELSPDTNWGDVGWRAVLTNTVTGQVQTYDIRGAETDSQSSQTRLCLRKVGV